MSETLKPCPFCGCSDINWSAGSIGTRFSCRTCHVSGPPVLDNIKGGSAAETMHLRRDRAAELWSARSTRSNSHSLLIEALEKIIWTRDEIKKAGASNSFDDGYLSALEVCANQAENALKAAKGDKE